MPSKAPPQALFEAPLKSDSVGGDQNFGRLVAAAALHGCTINQMAEKAALAELSARLHVSNDLALEILRGLKKHGESS